MRDLSNPKQEDLLGFAQDVILLAIAHHQMGKPLHYRTGRQLCQIFSDRYREGHKRFASTMYNQTRWSLKLSDANQ